MAHIAPPLLFIGTGDLYLHGQMLTYYAIALLLGIALGFLIWGWGRATAIKRARADGVREAEHRADAAGLSGEVGQLRTELDICTKARATLETRLEQAQRELRVAPKPALPDPAPQAPAPPSSEDALVEAPVEEDRAPIPPTETLEEPISVSEEAKAVVVEEPAADDLKTIKGIGAKLEAQLNSLGITRFDQIANWSAEEIADFDTKLKFKGRIERDDWVGQAQRLTGGDD